LSTPTPSLGKNIAGAYMRHNPSAIQPVDESGSGTRLDIGLVGSVFALVVMASPPGSLVRRGLVVPWLSVVWLSVVCLSVVWLSVVWPSVV
jgi:hypothetical protein